MSKIKKVVVLSILLSSMMNSVMQANNDDRDILGVALGTTIIIVIGSMTYSYLYGSEKNIDNEHEQSQTEESRLNFEALKKDTEELQQECIRERREQYAQAADRKKFDRRERLINDISHEELNYIDDLRIYSSR